MAGLEGATIIDDTDPRIKYSPGWHMDGSINEYNTTVHATSTADASFTFVFTGTSIKVFGTLTQVGYVPGSFPNTTYSLDGTTPVRYSGKPAPNVQYQQIFYQSPNLPNIEHTLIGTCADQGSLVWIDFFVVTAPAPSSSANETQSVSLTSFQAATTTIYVTQGASSSQSSEPQSPPVGAIVGSVIGAIVLMLIFLALLLWHRRRSAVISAEMQPTAFPRPSTPGLLNRPQVTMYPTETGSASASIPSIYTTTSSPAVALTSPSSSTGVGTYASSSVPPNSGRKIRYHQTTNPPSVASSARRGGEERDHPPAYQ